MGNPSRLLRLILLAMHMCSRALLLSLVAVNPEIDALVPVEPAISEALIIRYVKNFGPCRSNGPESIRNKFKLVVTLYRCIALHTHILRVSVIVPFYCQKVDK
jgi:hypothetical protein